MSVYTKRGDNGETSLYEPNNAQIKRVSKNSSIIEAIGSVDELNSFLGLIASKHKKQANLLQKIQKNLFTVNAILAGANLVFNPKETQKLESQIDEWEEILPVLTNFILPGGSEVSAELMYARSIARRAERKLAAIKPAPAVMSYLNRLSDFLFVMARYENQKASLKETIWKQDS